MKYKGKYIVLGIMICLLSGCVIQQSALFGDVKQSADITTYTLPAKPEFVIKSGDEVRVTISALQSDVVSPFRVGNDRYVLSADGTIVLPVIGGQKIAGMTEKQAANYIQTTLEKHVISPIVDVRIEGAKVVVMGEVYKPGAFAISQPITLFAALSMAGDMMPSARRDNVLVQRIEGSKVKQYRINLLTDDVYSSPCFYLQKDDMVYVSPKNDAKSKNK